MILIRIDSFFRNLCCFIFHFSVDLRLKFSIAQKRCIIFEVFPFSFFSHKFKNSSSRLFVFALLKVQEILQQVCLIQLCSIWTYSISNPSHDLPMVCYQSLPGRPLFRIRWELYVPLSTLQAHLGFFLCKLLVFSPTY